jgi:hypothetical protein
VRGAGVHDHGELLARGDDGGRGDRVRRVDPAREDVDVLLREELLDRDLRVGAARVLHVALDQRDLVGAHLVGVELEVQLHAPIDELAELGTDARERQGDAHLHFLGLGPAGGQGQRGEDGDHALEHVRFPPQRVNRSSSRAFRVGAATASQTS